MAILGSKEEYKIALKKQKKLIKENKEIPKLFITKMSEFLFFYLKNPLVNEHCAIILCNCVYEPYYKLYLTEFSLPPLGNAKQGY